MFINEYEEKIRKKCFGGNDNFFDWKGERWGAQFSLTVQAVTAVGESFELQVRASDQLGKLRAEIASRLGKTPHCVRLIIGDDMPEEGEMFYPLEHYRINADSVVQYFVCDESPPEKVEKQLASPLDVLSKNQHYFEQLFELLDDIAKQTQDASVTEVSQQAWSLIVKIPINPRLQGLLHNLDFAGDEAPWSSLIDPRSLYRLSYVLQIIELIFVSGKRPPTEPEGLVSSQENPGVVEWTRKFSEKGGFRHLFNILMTFKPESSSSASCSNSTPIFTSCLESLLSITNCFMLASCPRTYQNEESHLVLRPDGEFDWVDFSALLVRLLDILEQATEEGPGLKSSTSSTSSLVGSMSQLTLGNQGEIEGCLVRDTCDLLVACLTSKPDLLTVVYGHPNLRDFFKRVLVFSTNEHLRQQISKSLRIIILATSDKSPSVVPPLEVFLPLLLELLSDLPPRLQSCTQYFTLIVSLLHCCDRESPIHMSWLSNLFPLLFNLLQSHPIIEISNTDAPDRVLGGLLHILGNLIVIEPCLVGEEGRCLSLVKEVYNRCLFDGYPSIEHLSPSPPKCKTQYARVEAFALLKTLRVVAHEEVQTYLLSLIHQQHSGK
jgi:hypothetical protein